MTRYLLDTSVFLWNASEAARLGPHVQKLLRSANESIFVSAVTSLEIAVKHSLGKLRLPEPPRDYMRKRLSLTGFLPLPMTHEHALVSAELPNLHKDPFDRILVAQAQVEGLVLITADKQIAGYDVQILSAAK